MQDRRQSTPLFSHCFCGDFYMFEIWCFPYLLGIFLTHFRSVLLLWRNQPIDFNYLLMAWFLNNANAGWNGLRKTWLAAWYNTHVEILSCVREMFLFICNIGKKALTLTFCFNGMFSLIFIKGITSPPQHQRWRSLWEWLMAFSH